MLIEKPACNYVIINMFATTNLRVSFSIALSPLGTNKAKKIKTTLRPQL